MKDIVFNIEYLSKDNNFKKTVIEFNNYSEAVTWGRNNLDNFNQDIINSNL